MGKRGHEYFMHEALEQARRAFADDEVPVGAVVRLRDEIIARAYDQRQHTGDPTAHAEMLALRDAAHELSDWRLEQCTLYVTLEPCPMCAGLLILARVERLVYGAPNLKMGAVKTHCRLLDYPDFNHEVDVVSGVCADECAALLSRFFKGKRT